MKSTDFLRSSVMVMEERTASTFFTLSEGIRPSNSCSIHWHLTFISSHMALPMS
ncbi:hypothetical protein D3C76_1147070 [compost metagenome]